jgi:hypothetical protein
VSRRAAKRLAWSLWAVAIAMLVGGLCLSAASGGSQGPEDVIGAIVLVPVAATVGGLVTARVPSNPIGAIFLGLGVLGGMNYLLTGYSDLALPDGPGPQGLAEASAWITMWLWAPLTFVPLTFALILFPEGRLPSRRWLPFPWLAALGIAAFCAFLGLDPEAWEEAFGLAANPYGLDGHGALLRAVGLLGLAVVPALIGSVAAIIVRLRRARGEQRLQLKWLAYAGTLAVAVFIVGGMVLDGRTGVAPAIAAAHSLIPIAIAIGVLRYRLYDVDLVIRRTLVYGSVTAVLAGAYVVLVLLLQLALRPLTPEGALPVAVSTLAVAALFGPVRRRIQELVDRRFYRRKYDAQRTLEAFAARLRNEVDLDTLRAELIGAVAATMQPSHVSVWLRRPQAPPPSRDGGSPARPLTGAQ